MLPGGNECTATVVYSGGACNRCECALIASVIIPSFNAAEHLEEQLQALAAQQTPGPWELVVSDNGSQDNSVEVVRRFGSSLHRLVVLDASRRQGAAFARNAGAGAARSENLLFCDADDVVDRFWLSEIVRALESHRFVGGRVEMDDLNDGVPRFGRSGGDQAFGLPGFYGESRYVLTCNLGIKREDFLAAGGFDTEHFNAAAGEDVDFALRMSRRGRHPVFVPSAVVHYRLRASRHEALAQARHYGLANADLLIRDPELPLLSLRDDLTEYFKLARNTIRKKLVGQDARATWHLNYELAKTRRLAKTTEYWSLARRYQEPRACGSAARRGSALRIGVARLSNRLRSRLRS